MLYYLSITRTQLYLKAKGNKETCNMQSLFGTVGLQAFISMGIKLII